VAGARTAIAGGDLEWVSHGQVTFGLRKYNGPWLYGRMPSLGFTSTEATVS